MLLILVLVGLAAKFVSNCEACADPYTPKGKGNAIVTEVVNKINNLGIFPNDHKFLCRVAWVESKYGQARGTYRRFYHGGIWQVTWILTLEVLNSKSLVQVPILGPRHVMFCFICAVLTILCNLIHCLFYVHYI